MSTVQAATKFGPVLGRLENININGTKHSISAFRNIPYASTRRFEYASNPRSWSEPITPVRQTPHYPQPDEFNKSNWKTLPRIIKENEVSYHAENDDLPLNIFTPTMKGKAPVVVYVHG